MSPPIPTRLDEIPRADIEALATALEQGYDAHRAAGLSLDLTRGKPSLEQLELSRDLDGILGGDYRLADGSDARGYGGLDGIPEARALAAHWLGLEPHRVMVGGNSSLSLMYRFVAFARLHGPAGPASTWGGGPEPARFLCPVPGYDRHFTICDELGIDMIPVPLTGDGPDMDRVEALVESDRSIVGMWCVPKYSNPSGEVYSDGTVRRIARLATRAGPGFRVMWDNAYAVHDLYEPRPLANIMEAAHEAGTEDSIVTFGSTSKVTFAGGGLAFLGASTANLDWFRARLAVMTIGPDKVNQLRHVRALCDMDGVRALMAGHAAILRPKFEAVLGRLERELGQAAMGDWTRPAGGYFVSFDTLPGLAREVVALAGAAGVKLTPAGSAFPRGHDPHDCNIRLAPSFPALAEVDRAVEVFVDCVKLASVRRRLRQMNT